MQEVTVELGETGLVLRGAGQGHYVNYLWLRDNCPTSFSAVSRDRAFDVTSLDDGLRPAEALVEGQALHIVWAPEGHRSTYDLGWLLRWLAAPGHADAADVPQVLWRADHLPRLARFGFDAVRGDWETRSAYLAALLRDGLALVTGVPDAPDGITQVAEMAGHVRATFSGVYFNVRTYPNPAGAAYSAAALEPHTDNPCETHPPGLQYLHCRVNYAAGGESTFSDGAAIAADLRAAHPGDFALLATHDIPFRFAHDGMDMRAHQRVILTGPDGRITGVIASQHMADIFDLDQRLMDAYYPAFIRFLRMLRDPAYEISFTLKTGECVAFDNQRLLHGRRAFDPQSGARLLRGCYTDRGELRSRYRVLLRDGRISDAAPQGADQGV